jgi:hypothetical protein
MDAAFHRQELLVETDRYLADLIEEVGEPSAAAKARADAISKRLRRRSSKRPTS